jgi:hypothetical protein
VLSKQHESILLFMSVSGSVPQVLRQLFYSSVFTVRRMFKTVVVLFSLIWASLLLVSWSGGEQVQPSPETKVAMQPDF